MHMFNDSTDVMRAAAVGLGVVLARQHIAAPWLQRGELLRLPGPVPKTRFAYYVVHPAHRRPRAPAAAFIEWLREAAQDTTPAPEQAYHPVGAAPRSRPAAPAGLVGHSRRTPARPSSRTTRPSPRHA